MWLYCNDYNIKSNGQQSWQYGHTADPKCPTLPGLDTWGDTVRKKVNSHCILSCGKLAHSCCNLPLRFYRLALSWRLSWSHTFNWGAWENFKMTQGCCRHCVCMKLYTHTHTLVCFSVLFPPKTFLLVCWLLYHIKGRIRFYLMGKSC